MTDRDDFLREHLSPPSESGDPPAGRPPEPPPTAGQDDARTRNGVDDVPWPTGTDGEGRRVADDSLHRAPDEPGRPTGPADRRQRWTADSSQTHTGPQRIPPGGFRQGPPPPPRPTEAGAIGQPDGRPREAAEAEPTRVMPPTGARPAPPGWPQDPQRERSPRPVSQD